MTENTGFDLDEVRARHTKYQEWSMSYCWSCKRSWPCDAIRACDEVAALRLERDGLREELAAAEAPRAT